MYYGKKVSSDFICTSPYLHLTLSKKRRGVDYRTRKDRTLLQDHAIGYQMDALTDAYMDWCAAREEVTDGAGYYHPQLNNEDPVDSGSKMVKIVDVFSKLTTDTARASANMPTSC